MSIISRARSFLSHSHRATRRGDSIIEVMFALAIFSLVAITTIITMNAGLASSERSLELTVARNELNAQAEAIRFIHSAYISELTLGSCSTSVPTEICRHFNELWHAIVDGIPSETTVASSIFGNNFPPATCEAIYSGSALSDNKAFVLNTRNLGRLVNNDGSSITTSDIVIRTASIFRQAPLGPRLVYSSGSAEDTDRLSYIGGAYNTLKYAEGIWVIPAKLEHFYQFHIETCWYGSGDSEPSSLDTIIQLYNPESY